MAKMILIKEYVLQSDATCIDCGCSVDTGSRVYRNLETDEEVETDFRTGCSCSDEKDLKDPYEQSAS